MHQFLHLCNPWVRAWVSARLCQSSGLTAQESPEPPVALMKTKNNLCETGVI